MEVTQLGEVGEGHITQAVEFKDPPPAHVFAAVAAVADGNRGIKGRSARFSTLPRSVIDSSGILTPYPITSEWSVFGFIDVHCRIKSKQWSRVTVPSVPRPYESHGETIKIDPKCFHCSEYDLHNIFILVFHFPSSRSVGVMCVSRR